MRKKSVGVSLALFAAFAVASSPVSAQLINISTGVNAGGTALAAGGIDPFWQISNDGGATYNSGIVISDASNATCGCSVLANAVSGQWINLTGVTNSAYPIGPTIFHRRTFDLSGYNLATVALSGNWSVMDGLLGIFLNGSLLPGTTVGGAPTSNWSTTHAFAVAGASNFAAGLNTLEFRTTTVNGTWDGIMLQSGAVRGTLNTTVPEPESLALVAAGLVALAIARRRRVSV